MRYLDARILRDDGYLQEANREFFHPLGLALELELPAGTLRIQDYRDDLEGMRFADGIELMSTALRFFAIRDARRKARRKALGYWQQHLEPA